MLRVVCCSLVLFALSTLGCNNGGPYPVSGTVTFDGQPVESGEIKFVPLDTKLGPEGGRIEKGKFSLTAKAGKNRVEIDASKPTGKKSKGAMGEDIDETARYIPARYNQQSTLNEDITGSRSDVKYDLTK